MIYITGDTHADIDWGKLNTTNFPEQKFLDKDDYVIILGDFGGLWDGANQDKYILDWYKNKSFMTLFIDGNHENHDLLDSYPVQEWHGGKVHFIADNIIHLMRGQVFEIDGMTFFTMGGAESTDKWARTEGKSWWSRELPSKEEYEEAILNLKKHDFKVDYVLTHCCPEKTLAWKTPGINDGFSNGLTNFFDHLVNDFNLEFKGWYFGHYHINFSYENFHCLYNEITKISTEKDRIKFNKKLCEKYPFLIPIEEESERKLTEIEGKNFNYSCTVLDYMAEGWRKAFGLQMCEELKKELVKIDKLNDFYIVQIKEKFGELRIYPNEYYSPKITEIIDKYTEISRRTCIVCGRPATKITLNWIAPFCNYCCPKDVRTKRLWEFYS